MTTEYKFNLGDKVWWATFGLRKIVGCAPASKMSGICYLLEDVKGFEVKEYDIRSWQHQGFSIDIPSIIIGEKYGWIDEKHLTASSGSLPFIIEEIKKDIYG